MRKASCARRTSTSTRGSRRSIRPSRRASIRTLPVEVPSASTPSPSRVRRRRMSGFRRCASIGRSASARACRMRAIRRTSIRSAKPPIAARDGECFDRPFKLSASGGSGAGHQKRRQRPKQQLGGRHHRSAHASNEFVAEIDGAMSLADADALARRHGLERVASQNFPLIDATIGLFRITDGRPPDTVRREFAADASVQSVQLNFRYVLQDQKQADADRGRSGAICGRQAQAAAGAHAGARHERDDRRDRLRHRRQTSRTRQLDRRQFRCARQQGRPACPRHRHCRRHRRPCPADGQRAGGAHHRDPRLRQRAGRGRKLLLCHPQEAQLRRRARRADRQYELCRAEGSDDRARHRRDRGPRRAAGRRRRQCRSRNRRRSIPPPIRT